jgi:hypothetical protein
MECAEPEGYKSPETHERTFEEAARGSTAPQFVAAKEDTAGRIAVDEWDVNSDGVVTVEVV